MLMYQGPVFVGSTIQSCSVLGAGSREFWKDGAAHVIENGIVCSGVGLWRVSEE